MQRRARNEPKSGIANPNLTANLSGPDLACIEADVCNQILAFTVAGFLEIYTICTLLHMYAHVNHRSKLKLCRILQVPPNQFVFADALRVFWLSPEILLNHRKT